MDGAATAVAEEEVRTAGEQTEAPPITAALAPGGAALGAAPLVGSGQLSVGLMGRQLRARDQAITADANNPDALELTLADCASALALAILHWEVVAEN